MNRAKKHLERCEEIKCTYCSNNKCCFGLRYLGCADEIGIEKKIHKKFQEMGE